MQNKEISKIIKQLVASNKIEEAIRLLINFIKSEKELNKKYFDNIVLISSKYSHFKTNQIKGIISNSEMNLENNRIISSILTITNIIDSEVPDSKRQVEILGGKNVIINSEINIEGDFHIGDKIEKSDEKFIQKLLESQSKIKILFLASNPLNTNPLRLDKEMRDIETELIRSKYRDNFEFIKFTAVRIKDFQDALLNHAPNFVHFSGHGNSEGIAMLGNNSDNSTIVKSEPLANLFKLFSNDISTVFLNSCFSQRQGLMIRKFIPNVIGMNKAVPDDTAIEFATVFYKGIGAGREIGFSYELAKNSIDLNNISGSDIPIKL